MKLAIGPSGSGKTEAAIKEARGGEFYYLCSTNEMAEQFIGVEGMSLKSYLNKKRAGHLHPDWPVIIDDVEFCLKALGIKNIHMMTVSTGNPTRPLSVMDVEY